VNSSAEKVLTIITLVSIPTVMYGGFSLLRLLAPERLNEFQVRFFRAGHAHAGVLLVLTLAALDVAGRFGVSSGLTWIFGILLLVGASAQGGGMFIHMGVGSPGKWSWGNTVTSIGALVLVAGIVVLIYGVAVS
jgi:hypothetical protein